jgi:hypothetical protein
MAIKSFFGKDEPLIRVIPAMASGITKHCVQQFDLLISASLCPNTKHTAYKYLLKNNVSFALH